MFDSQHLPVYAVSLHPLHLRQTEAPRTMPPTISRSATFEELALPLFASLYNHAFWLTRDQSEAEDLVQETFSKALRAFDSFQLGTNFKAWIFRILRNTFLTSRTGIATSRTVFLEDHPDTLGTGTGSTPEDTLIRLDNQAALHLALEQLQPQLREVLLLSATWKKLNTKTSPPSSTSPSAPSCRASLAPAALSANFYSRSSENHYDSDASNQSVH